MTITTTTSRNDYIASAAQTIFPYTFKILVDSDLEVYIDGTLKTLSTHYTVSGVGGSGGNVTFLTPMVGGENVAIIRNIPLTQETDYVENDPFPAETHEAALDKLTMIAQQVENRSQRSIRIPESDSTGTLTELPSNTARALKYLFFDSDGDAGVTAVAPTGTAVITPFWETVLDDASASVSVETIRNALSSEPAVSLDDEVFIRDTSATTGKRTTIENVLNAINLLTEDALPDNTADFVLTYDTSTLSLKKVKPGNLIRHEPRRQTVVAGSVDANGQANFLSAGTGLAVSMAATTTPVVATFANGENEFGPINYRTRFSADQADYWSSLPANNTSFLLLERNSSTGAITSYQTLVPPQHRLAFDKTRQSLLHFEGADASTTITDTYGNTWAAAGNAQIDTGVAIDSQNTLLLDGTGDYVESTAHTSLGSESWQQEIKARFAALPSAGTDAVIFDATNASGYGVILALNNTAGTYKLKLSLSSNGSAHDIASGALGTSTAWAISTNYHITVGYDAVAGKYFVYKDGTAEAALTTTSASKICAITSIRLGSTKAGGSYFNGNMAGFRFSPCCRYPNGATFTPPTLPFTTDAEWFDLSEFKWKFGAPGAWTEKQRVCVGETTTGAAAPSSVTTYALRGYVQRSTVLAAAAAAYSVSHNIGMRCKATSVARCISNDGGAQVGHTYGIPDINDGDSGTGTTMFGVSHNQTARNSTTIQTGNTGIGIVRSGGGAAVLMTAGKWVAETTFERDW